MLKSWGGEATAVRKKLYSITAAAKLGPDVISAHQANVSWTYIKAFKVTWTLCCQNRLWQ